MAKKPALGKGLGALLGNEFDNIGREVRYVSETPHHIPDKSTEDNAPEKNAAATAAAFRERVNRRPLGATCISRCRRLRACTWIKASMMGCRMVSAWA